MKTGPLPAPSKCKSGLPRITGTDPGWWKQSFRLQLWSLVWFQLRATSCHLISSKWGDALVQKWGDALVQKWGEALVQKWGDALVQKWGDALVQKWGDALVQSGGRWQSLGVAAGLGAGLQVQKDPGLTPKRVLRLCTLLSLATLLPRPEPAKLLRLVLRREHHQHDLPQHQNQADRRHPPSIRRAPAGACGKGMFPVPDPYRGGDWGWRRLHWIDVSSTT